MWITFLGIAAFVLLFIYDLATVQKTKYRFAMAFVAYGLHLTAIIAAALGDHSLAVPAWLAPPAWILAIIGLIWLCHCLLLFTPVKQSYFTSKCELSTEGPYALARHPGVMGYAVLVAGLSLASRSWLLLANSLVWLGCDLLHVFLQDRWIFPRIFEGYEKYRLQTPMLIPDKVSIRRFMTKKKLDELKEEDNNARPA